MRLGDEIRDRSPQGIAGVIARLITEGVLVSGDRLPTVRDLAAELMVSPATVSAAWQALARTGMIVSRGRAGTFVRGMRRDWLTRRVNGLSAHAGEWRLDLSLGTPDPALLPSLKTAFSHVSLRADTGRYHDLPVLPELAALLERTWPSRAGAITVVDGALDGISRTLEQVVRFGDRVAVESPGFPYFFDLIDALGAEAVPLRLDDEGVLPGSLAHALSERPTAVILQPRAHNPTGASMSAERARRLAGVIGAARDGDRVVVIEDDHSGLISMAPDVTLGRWLPDQVVHVRSFSKSHGPDLRIAALGGPARIVERIVARRMLGPGWTSRLLQTVLLDMLTDRGAVAAVRVARLAYRDREEALVSALRREGVQVPHPDGLNLWLPVADERAAAVHLATAGIAVAAGAPFVVGDHVAPHVRVTSGMVAADAADVARELARASRAAPR
ncbi:aminotransferase class I/II-fold pyridoxal phosphate-dependent enzyme [Microbacterium terricola]|uniref:GntR family transcriptional regulator n=1 Tax=Microbacterium terricola TaxID=344163 RepID=A0ABM8DVK3_9MICO|nr:aminotransferase class I/II-fold pyridoxal phosphate-dependent enzyme [Microbacterium terricola]UYK39590.1 aminotransferase class I/II-fold pyridoxal phosphate-dependent enzyme [Microbacterium terricola]BDV29673.1 GntR family transcriptional regulator [Microbacterium terricola]